VATVQLEKPVDLCEGGATTAALQLLVAAAGVETEANDTVSWGDEWLAAGGTAGAVAVPVTLRAIVASATVSLLTPFTTSDNVLLSTTNESPTAAVFDCQQTYNELTYLHSTL